MAGGRTPKAIAELLPAPQNRYSNPSSSAALKSTVGPKSVASVCCIAAPQTSSSHLPHEVGDKNEAHMSAICFEE